MGMRKKWSRIITVDEVGYRYHIAEDRPGGYALNICIQRIEPAGQRLLSGFGKPLAWTDVGPGHRVGTVVPHAITPSVIRRLILAALDRGWRPSDTGLGEFYLPGHHVTVALPIPTEHAG